MNLPAMIFGMSGTQSASPRSRDSLRRHLPRTARAQQLRRAERVKRNLHAAEQRARPESSNFLAVTLGADLKAAVPFYGAADERARVPITSPTSRIGP